MSRTLVVSPNWVGDLVMALPVFDALAGSLIDLARWFLGDVEKVTGFASNHTWKKPGCEDNGFVLLRGTNGRVAYVQGSWTEWRGFGYRMEIYGTEGFVRFSYPPLWLVHAHGKPGNKMKFKRHMFLPYQIKERLKGWQWSLVETLVLDLCDWAGAIATGAPPPSSGRDGLEAVRIAQSVEYGFAD